LYTNIGNPFQIHASEFEYSKCNHLFLEKRPIQFDKLNIENEEALYLH